MGNWDKTPEIDLFSDGGAEPNPGNGGFGVIMSYKGKRKEFFKGYRLTTNNRMELMGVIFGLQRLKTKSIVNVYTDSKYVIDGIEFGWAKNEKAINHDLWARLLELIEKHESVKFNWVKGHAGHPENERCDELANLGINSDEMLEDEGYAPNEKPKNTSETSNQTKVKITKEGDPCRKCGTPVVIKRPKKRKIKENQSYYFEWYLYCPNCRNMYMVEEAKRMVDNSGQLF